LTSFILILSCLLRRLELCLLLHLEYLRFIDLLGFLLQGGFHFCDKLTKVVQVVQQGGEVFAGLEVKALGLLLGEVQLLR